jgi:hypothetical protein
VHETFTYCTANPSILSYFNSVAISFIRKLQRISESAKFYKTDTNPDKGTSVCFNFKNSDNLFGGLAVILPSVTFLIGHSIIKCKIEIQPRKLQTVQLPYVSLI